MAATTIKTLPTSHKGGTAWLAAAALSLTSVICTATLLPKAEPHAPGGGEDGGGAGAHQPTMGVARLTMAAVSTPAGSVPKA